MTSRSLAYRSNTPQAKLHYSKSSSFYMSAKADFFESNDQNLEHVLRQNNLYRQQPARNACKICGALLKEAADFEQHGICYKFCRICDHLNGCNDDSEDFVNKIYISDDGEDYAIDYIAQKYIQRSKDIYLPKLMFMLSSIGTDQKILDVGCGSGFFVYCCLRNHLDAAGFDVSKRMIDYGNSFMTKAAGVQPLSQRSEGEFYDEIVKSDASVISAIGVIEHLRDPQRLFDAFKKSKAKFIFYSVPMFSLSAILEGFFQNVFPRQLSGAHTHLFTEPSLAEMNRQMNAVPIAEWRFGTDIIDLYRNLSVGSQKRDTSEHFRSRVSDSLLPIVDQLQEVLDRQHVCSEIHVVAKRLS